MALSFLKGLQKERKAHRSNKAECADDEGQHEAKQVRRSALGHAEAAAHGDLRGDDLEQHNTKAEDICNHSRILRNLQAGGLIGAAAFNLCQ